MAKLKIASTTTPPLRSAKALSSSPERRRLTFLSTTGIATPNAIPS